MHNIIYTLPHPEWTFACIIGALLVCFIMLLDGDKPRRRW